MAFVEIAGVRLETRVIPGDVTAPWLVFLHEGLGSVSQWRDFPDKVARRVGARALVYARRGYGRSDPLDGPRGPDFMHREALDVLPALCAHFAIAQPILIGHSDGASIALIHAAHGDDVAGVVLMAPHVKVEPISVASIARVRAAYLRGELKERLARHHAHVDDAFLGWADAWLDPRFRDWSLAPEIARLRCPALLIQGEEDEYGTLAQIDDIAAGAMGPTQRLVLPACGHAPQRDRSAEVIAAIAGFIDELGPC
jgi:pimeloyl-ACP methyl ester carboxylesterase